MALVHKSNDSVHNEEKLLKQTYVFSNHKKNEKFLLIMTKNYFVWFNADKSDKYLKKVKRDNPKQCHSKQLNTNNHLENNCSNNNNNMTGYLGEPLRSDTFVKFSDIIGVKLVIGSNKLDIGCYLKVFAYPKQKRLFNKTETRKRKEILFYFHNHSILAENEEEVNSWIKVYNEQINNTPATVSRKKLLVFVNPFSGSGEAMHIYENTVVPMLVEADIQFETIATKYAGHAKEFVKSLTTSAWEGIVVVSGDGLVYEVVNGLMERPDWKVSIKMPIGVVPGGSGNALASSILYQAGESYLENIIQTSTLFVIKNHAEPIDLVAIETQSGNQLYSFLSITWGIIADVDIESEQYRSLGKRRFLLGAIKRILNLRKYKGVLSFLPICNDKSTAKVVEPLKTITSALYGNNEQQDGCGDDMASSANVDEIFETNNQIKRTSNTPEHATDCGGMDRPSFMPTSLNQPVPDNWTQIKADDIVGVVALYQSHLGQDMKCCPSSKLNDGCIFLFIIKGDVSKIKMLKYFKALEDGSIENISDPYCQLYKVKAFRIEPCDKSTEGYLAVDGEKVDYGALQGWVVEGLARIMKPW